LLGLYKGLFYALSTCPSKSLCTALLSVLQKNIISFTQLKLEFLALKWAILKWRLNDLFHAPSFTVYTDNVIPLHSITMARLDVAGQRWVAELADYNFTINYRPVRANVDAGWLCILNDHREPGPRFNVRCERQCFFFKYNVPITILGI